MSDIYTSSITIPDGVTEIGPFKFSGCENLTSITIPDGVKTIGYGAFLGCENLTSITIPDSVKYIGDEAFRDCKNLTSIIIPDGVTEIGHDAFRDCENLTSITIPDSVKYIGDGAFCSCYNLTSITIPDGVTTIDDYAFYSCYNLTSITIPDGVTWIGDSAFCDCENLTSIIIPDSVKKIGDDAFNGCENLTITCSQAVADMIVNKVDEAISFKITDKEPLRFYEKNRNKAGDVPMINDYKFVSHTFSNGITIVNTTPHPLNFLSPEGEKVVIPTSVPEGEKTGFAVINAKAVETDVAPHIVETIFEADESGQEIIAGIKETFKEQNEAGNLMIVGSMIAANAYIDVRGMCPAPGFERVPPAEKLMSCEKFTQGKAKESELSLEFPKQTKAMLNSFTFTKRESPRL